MAFTANFESMGSGYHICEGDADGISTPIIRIYSSGFAKDIKLAEDVSRLVLLALNMDGGLQHATELLRAAMVRQNV